MNRTAEARPGEIDAVFLDVGGTLVGMDYARMAAVATDFGAAAEADDMLRAEAAARPAVSAALAAGGGAAEDFFIVLMRTVTANLPAANNADRNALATALAELIPAYGGHHDFWNTPLPGAAAGLARLAKAGVPLVAVSNSDGSAERVLIEAGLRDHFITVIDSHHVGVSKPDPKIFDHAFQHCGAERARTLYIGDIYAGDVIAARRAGMIGGLVDPFGDYAEVDCPVFEGIDHLADHLL